MWESREALADLDLPNRSRILDVGCGTGELTRVLAEEAPDSATVVGVDADPDLLDVARQETRLSYLAGDATRLPFSDNAFDLVVCQALLVNVPDPAAAVAEFARVSADRVAAIEPDNAAVGVSSTVDAEANLAREARTAYRSGVATDVALGDRVGELFGDAGLSDVDARRYHHEKRIAPPYTEAALEGAKRKASGEALADRQAELERALGPEGYDDLRRRWRAMGRDVVRAMNAAEYERVEVVPFDVTVGRSLEPDSTD